MTLKKEALTDRELVAASREGNDEAFRALFDKYWDDLYVIASRRVASPEDIKDLLQEVFLSLWKNISTIVIIDSLGGYLYTALRNKIINYYEKRESDLHAMLNRPFIPSAAENLAWANLKTTELRKLIEAEILKLPPQMKQVFQLSREEQLTNQEIAELLSLAPQTVKNQLHRALERIRLGLKNANPDISPILLLIAIRHF